VADLAANERRLFVGALADRFGDYGIVAVMHVRKSGDALLIEDLLISCRALGRLVEETLLAFARCEAERLGMKKLSARFVAGPRNQQVPTLFERSGFTAVERDDAGILFTIDLDDDCLPWPEHVAVDTNGQKAEAS
jgi:FkbH-like protein